MNRSLCKKDDKTILKNCIIVYSNYSLHIKLTLGASDFNSSHLHSFSDNCHKDRCIRNGILRKGKYLESRNRRYRFYLRENGNLVLTCDKRPIWISFTKNDNVDFLHFNEEGTKFILRGKDNRTVWSAFSSGQGKELVLQDNGMLVLYNFCNEIIWEKGNSQKCQTGLV